jgi:two-component system CheB/CheR fusion protein
MNKHAPGEKTKKLTGEQRSAPGRTRRAAPQDKPAAAESGIHVPTPRRHRSTEAVPDGQQLLSTLYPVIGTSGLQAFGDVLKHLDPNLGMALVLVTHFAPDQKDFLFEIAQHLAQIPVVPIESVPVPMLVLNQDCTIRAANTAFHHLVQMQANELESRFLPELVHELWGVAGMAERLKMLANSPLGSIVEFEHQCTAPQGKRLLIKSHALGVDKRRMLLMTIQDLIRPGGTEYHGATGRASEQLRRFTARVLTVQEEERQRIARELHDDISQRLSLLEIALQEMRLDDGPADEVKRLKLARELVHSLNSDVREISHRLYPAILDDLGLSVALKVMVKDFGNRENMPVNYVTRDLPESWSPQAAIAIYRIAQESLSNIARHAGKTHVKVILSGTQNGLRLRVTDFGVGFDQEVETPTRGLGIIAMQERARLAGGTVTLQSTLGQGTTVIADIPLERHA